MSRNINTSGPIFLGIAVVDEQRARIGVALREELKRACKGMLKKRLHTPGPDLEPGPNHCMAEPEERRTKRRKIIMGEGETGDWAATRRGKTREMRVRRTPATLKNKSKLGSTQGLMRTLVVPSQGLGVYPSPPLGTTMEAALGPTESRDQAWDEGRQRTEDAHNEGETDQQRWHRLMLFEDGKWRCKECEDRSFSDRSGLQRHCRSSVHAKKRDIRYCPHCANTYTRQSGLKRHMKKEHAS
jgi:hypothetical protein